MIILLINRLFVIVGSLVKAKKKTFSPRAQYAILPSLVGYNNRQFK